MTPLVWDGLSNGNVGGGVSRRHPGFAEWHVGGVERHEYALFHVSFHGVIHDDFHGLNGVKNGVKYGVKNAVKYVVKKGVKKGVKNAVKMREIDLRRAIAVPTLAANNPSFSGVHYHRRVVIPPHARSRFASRLLSRLSSRCF